MNAKQREEIRKINESFEQLISQLSTVLYASWGRGGGTGNVGSRVRTADGYIDWDAMSEAVDSIREAIETIEDAIRI